MDYGASCVSWLQRSFIDMSVADCASNIIMGFNAVVEGGTLLVVSVIVVCATPSNDQLILGTVSLSVIERV